MFLGHASINDILNACLRSGVTTILSRLLYNYRDIFHKSDIFRKIKLFFLEQKNSTS